MASLSQGRERVTAGLPSLAPSLRAERDQAESTRQLSNDALAEQKQRAEASVAADGARVTTSLEAQLGRPLATAEFQRRLAKCNSNLRFERSLAHPRLAGVYIVQYRRDAITSEHTMQKRFVCGMEAEFMPEFTVRHVELITQPDPTIPGATRKIAECVDLTMGWRTVLVRLLHEGLITQGQIERRFGVPSHDSANWQNLTT